MGRRGQLKHQNVDTKGRHGSNLISNQHKLQELIDKLLRLGTVPQPQNVSQALDLQLEISEVTKQVKKLEEQLDIKDAVGNRCDGAIVEQFTNWLHENGATFKNIEISEFPGYELGLKAKTDIKESSLIITVPRKLMLTVEAARNSELSALIEKDTLLNNMPNVALAIFLLLEKFKGNSFWKPYINILPAVYSTVLYFNTDDLRELQSSPTLENALKQIKNIVRQYAYFRKLIWTSDDPACKILKKHFTYNQYCWAVSTVMTRQNTVPSEDGTQLINALIPLWDLCNHTNGTITTNYNPVEKRSECLAVKDFKENDQIFIFYGARSNADLFIHNGFVYDDNEHDVYCLRLGISKSDPLQDKRAKLLEELGLSNHEEFWLRKGQQPVDGQLLAFLRIFNMNEGQLQHWMENNKCNNLFNLECALDTPLENKSWSFLQARMKLLLATYKTTLEDDLKLIGGNQMTDNKILGIKMRASEKRILKGVLDYAEQRIRL